MRLLVRLHHRTRVFFRGQVLAQEYPQEVLIPVSASISVSHSSRGVQLLRGTKVPLLPTPNKYPRKRCRFPVLSRNINLVAFLDCAIKADLPTNIGCCPSGPKRFHFSKCYYHRDLQWWPVDQGSRSGFYPTTTLSYLASRISCYGLAINFLSQYIRQVSCNTLLSGFQLPWPPSCCQYALTSFN